MSRYAVLLIALASTQPAFAQTSPAPRATAKFGALRPAQSNPYGKLFDAKSLAAKARELAAKQDAPKRTVVCGLTIIPGDPTIDPKFAIGKKDDGIDYKMRTIDPPVCKP